MQFFEELKAASKKERYSYTVHYFLEGNPKSREYYDFKI